MGRKTRIVVIALSILAVIGLAFGVGRMIGSDSTSNPTATELGPVVGTWQNVGEGTKEEPQTKLTIDENGVISGSCTGTVVGGEPKNYWLTMDCGTGELPAATGVIFPDWGHLLIHIPGQSDLSLTMQGPLGDITK